MNWDARLTQEMSRSLNWMKKLRRWSRSWNTSIESTQTSLWSFRICGWGKRGSRKNFARCANNLQHKSKRKKWLQTTCYKFSLTVSEILKSWKKRWSVCTDFGFWTNAIRFAQTPLTFSKFKNKKESSWRTQSRYSEVGSMQSLKTSLKKLNASWRKTWF